VQLEASGFFRVAQVKERWVLVDPDGHPYIALGANHTGKFLQDPEQSAAYLARFGGSLPKAKEHMLGLYHELGYNAGEAYPPHDDYLRTNLPYVAHIIYPTRSHFERDIFDPAVQDSIFQSTLEQAAALRQDTLVIGIAFKDLPNWSSRRVDYYRQLPANMPGKQAYVAFLRERYENQLDRLQSGIWHCPVLL